MKKKKNRKLNKLRIFAASIIVFFLFYLTIKSIYGVVPKGVSIEKVSVSELTSDEKKQLRKHDNSYHLDVAHKKGLSAPIKADIKEASKKHLNWLRI